MTPPDGPGENTWWRMLTDQWVYKLAALFLVTLLWINVTAEERQPTAIRTLLEIDVQDSSWVLVGAPESVRTTFQGRNREMLALLAQPPVIRQVIDSVTSPTVRVSLSSEQVAYDRALSVRPSSVEPGTIELHFERRSERRVPVLPAIEATAAMGFTVVRPFRPEPDSVIIRGAASTIEGIRSLTTRRISIRDLEHTVVRDLPVLPPNAAAPALEISPASVLVTISVDSLVERRVQLPIEATGAAASSVTLAQGRTVAVVRGGSAAVTRLMARLSSAVVRVDTAPEGRMPFRLEVPAADSESVSLSLEPEEVMVAPRSGG